MFCKVCGSLIEDDSYACPHCGSAVERQINITEELYEINSDSTENNENNDNIVYDDLYDNVAPNCGYMLDSNKSMLLLILLSILTCGIYGIIFWCRFVSDIDVLCKGDGDYTPSIATYILLNIVTCGIYSIIWFYKLGNRIFYNSSRYDVKINEDGGFIILWFILGIFTGSIIKYIGIYYVIRNSNLLCEKYNEIHGLSIQR